MQDCWKGHDPELRTWILKSTVKHEKEGEKNHFIMWVVCVLIVKKTFSETSYDATCSHVKSR